MKNCLAVCLLLLGLTSVARGASIKWTGYADNNQWDSKTNWYPDQVPGANDDVTFSCGYAIITTPVTVNSLGMGDKFSCNATLSVQNSLTVLNTLTVEGNGILQAQAGTSQINPGQGNIAGTFTFTAGSVSGTWTVSAAGVVDMSGGGQKLFTGAGFNSSGPVTISGLIVLNQSSIVGLAGTTTGSGLLQIASQDDTTVLFDTSAGTLTYNGGGTLLISCPVKFGTFNWNSGNLTLQTGMTFSAMTTIPQGSALRVQLAAVVNLAGGLAGNGEVKAEGNPESMLWIGGGNYSGVFYAQAGLVRFTSATSVNSLMIVGADVYGTVTATNLNLQTGSIQTGAVVTGATTQVLSQGFIVNGSVIFTGSASVVGSLFAFGKHGKITVASGATLTATASVTFTGPAGSHGVENDGIIDASGSLSFQNIDLKGSGSVTVSDELRVNTITLAQSLVALSGSGVFKGETTDITGVGAVTGSPSVSATIGSYTFSCPKECKNVKTIGIPASNFHFKVGSS